MTQAERVEALLEEVRLASDARHALMQSVRSLYQRTIGPIDEEVKYGGILFSSDGVQVGGVFVYAEHVSVEFSKGASIPDAHGFLEGTGKGRRHVKLRAPENIDGKRLAAYLPLALEASRG